MCAAGLCADVVGGGFGNTQESHLVDACNCSVRCLTVRFLICVSCHLTLGGIKPQVAAL